MLTKLLDMWRRDKMMTDIIPHMRVFRLRLFLPKAVLLWKFPSPKHEVHSRNCDVRGETKMKLS